jgi:hypothetical protein
MKAVNTAAFGWHSKNDIRQDLDLDCILPLLADKIGLRWNYTLYINDSLIS